MPSREVMQMRQLFDTSMDLQERVESLEKRVAKLEVKKNKISTPRRQKGTIAT